ncbi:MAG TPA: hypothetical protein VMY05_02380 [Acidobacteriota bacterium]|nr:hypothetical protein [Acidobacteriota bacterium]
MLDAPATVIWLPIITVAVLLCVVIVHFRTRGQLRLLKSVLGSFDQPLLFYDEHDRLAFHTSGLVLFDRQALRKIRRLSRRPQPDRELQGEIEIDHNTYRYQSRLLEYRPGRYGTIVLLEYHRPTRSVV